MGKSKLFMMTITLVYTIMLMPVKHVGAEEPPPSVVVRQPFQIVGLVCDSIDTVRTILKVGEKVNYEAQNFAAVGATMMYVKSTGEPVCSYIQPGNPFMGFISETFEIVRVKNGDGFKTFTIVKFQSLETGKDGYAFFSIPILSEEGGKELQQDREPSDGT